MRMSLVRLTFLAQIKISTYRTFVSETNNRLYSTIITCYSRMHIWSSTLLILGLSRLCIWTKFIHSLPHNSVFKSINNWWNSFLNSGIDPILNLSWVKNRFSNLLWFFNRLDFLNNYWFRWFIYLHIIVGLYFHWWLFDLWLYTLG